MCRPNPQHTSRRRPGGSHSARNAMSAPPSRPRENLSCQRREYALEGIGDALEPTRSLGDDVEADPAASELGSCGEPGLRGTAQAALLLAVDHLERVAEARAALALHLAEDELRAPARDHVELVPARPFVDAEDAVPADPVPPHGTELRRVPWRSSEPRTSGGGPPTAPAHGRPPRGPA